MISGNVIEEGAFRLKNLIKGGGTSAFKAGNNAYAVLWFDYTTPLIKNHYYFVCYKYYYTKTGTTAPTWVAFYPDGGSGPGLGTVNPLPSDISKDNPVTGYGAFYLNWHYLNVTYNGGRLYHGDSSETSNGTVTPYYKAVCLFDITLLYKLNKNKYTLAEYREIIWPEIKKWMEKGDTSFLIDPKTNSSASPAPNKSVSIGGDYIYGKIVEAEGLMNANFSPKSAYGTQKYFADLGQFVSIYNNLRKDGKNEDIVTQSRVEDTSNPFYPDHPYVTKVVTQNGVTGTTVSPNLGGIVFGWYGNSDEVVIVQKLIAKIPVGYSIEWNSNIGVTTYASDRSGTGAYKEYTAIYNKKWTSDDTASRGGYVSIVPGTDSDKTSVTWYVAFYGNFLFNKSNYETYQGFSIMPNKDCIKSNTLLASRIDSQNLLPNGDGSDNTMTLPSKYLWGDPEGETLEGYHCLILPSVSSTIQDPSASDGGPRIIGEPIPINPMSKYRLTYRVKAEVVPSSYLSAIVYYRWDGSKYIVLSSLNTTYRTGTRTKLTTAAAAGATTLILESVTDWKTGVNYAGVGFKSDPRKEFQSGDVYRNSTGSKNCLVTAIDTTKKTITLANGVTKSYPVGTYVYLAQDMSNYLYPLSNSSLTAGKWIECSCEFGVPSQAWDGSTTGKWEDIPFFATHMGFAPNIYANNTGKPIYYDNIRIEEINSCGEKRCDKVLLKRYVGERGGVNFDPDLTFNITGTIPSGVLIKIGNGWYLGTNKSVSLQFHYKDSVFIYIDNNAFYTYGVDPYYKPTSASISIDGETIKNGSYFTMPYKDVSFTISTVLQERYRIKKGTFTSGVSIAFDTGMSSLDSDSLTSDYLEVSAAEQISWFLYDISDDLLASVNQSPGLKITLVDKSGNTTVVCDDEAGTVTNGFFTVSKSGTLNVEIYEYSNEHTITLSNSSNWYIETDDTTLNESNKKVTCKTGSLLKWKFYSKAPSYSGAIKSIISDVTFTPTVSCSIYNDVISFYVPADDVSMKVNTTEKTYYQVSSDLSPNSTTMSCYVNGKETHFACPGDKVQCILSYAGSLLYCKYVYTDSGDMIGYGSHNFTFTMPEGDVTVKAQAKQSSTGGGSSGDLEGTLIESFRVLNIPGTYATRVPRAGTSLNTPMINYKGAFDELTEYYANYRDLLIEDSNTFRKENLEDYSILWEEFGYDGNSIYALRNYRPDVIIDFWVSEAISKLDFLVCTTDLSGSFQTIELNQADFSVGSGDGITTITGTYYAGDGYLCRLITNNYTGYVSSVWFAVNGEYQSSYIITFDNVIAMSELTHDSNDLVLCPNFLSSVILSDTTFITNPLLYAEDSVISNYVPSNLDGLFYSLYNQDALGTGTYADTINLNLGWDDPDNTYITLAVILKPTSYDYNTLADNNDWVQLSSASSLSTQADETELEPADSESGKDDDVMLPDRYLINEPLGTVANVTGDFITLTSGNQICINFKDAEATFGVNLTDASSENILYLSIIYRGLMWVFLSHTYDQEITMINPTYDSSAENLNYWIDSELATDQGYKGKILNIAYN